MPAKTNGEKKTVKLNTIINDAMHRPYVEENGSRTPIYTRVQTAMNAAKAQEKTDRFKKASQSNLNSATNIRAIFITHERVGVQYYKEPIIGGKQSPGNTYASERLSGDLEDDAKTMASFPMASANYMNEKMMNPGAIAPDNCRIIGNTFGVINEPFACNNIEEVYVDWTVFLGEETRQLFGNSDLGPYMSDQGILTFIEGNYGAQEIQSATIQSMFVQFAFDTSERSKIQQNPDAMRRKFPRLRMIAMISNLDSIISGHSDKKLNSVLTELKNNERLTWFERNKQLIDSSNSIVIVSKIPCKFPNSDFNVKDTQYEYDRRILKPFSTMYTKAVKDKERQLKYGETEEEVQEAANIDEASVEGMLLRCEKENPKDFPAILSMTARAGFGVRELTSQFREFSKPNRTKWAKIIGLKLE